MVSVRLFSFPVPPFQSSLRTAGTPGRPRANNSEISKLLAAPSISAAASCNVDLPTAVHRGVPPAQGPKQQGRRNSANPRDRYRHTGPTNRCAQQRAGLTAYPRDAVSIPRLADRARRRRTQGPHRQICFLNRDSAGCARGKRDDVTKGVPHSFVHVNKCGFTTPRSYQHDQQPDYVIEVG